MILKNKRRTIILFITVILLLIPLIAMQFTDEVNWTFFDFVIAGFLLLGFGLICEVLLRKLKKIKYRIAICLALIIIFLLIWADLAIGIFGFPFSGN